MEKLAGYYVSFLLYDKFGLFPSPADAHVAEFLPHFLREEAGRGALYGLTLYPEGTIYDHIWREQASSRLVKWAAGEASMDELFKGEFTEETLVIRTLESFVSGRNDFYEAANVPNLGAISNLPEEAIVEVHVVAGAVGVRPVHIGPLPDAIVGMLRQQLAYVNPTVDAALTGDRKTALRALLTHPLVATPEIAEKMPDDLIEHESKYLPQFK